MEAPKNKASEGARVIDFNAFKRKKLTNQMFDDVVDDLTAPGPMHPAARAMKKKNEESKDEN
jgi:hypothetical protein